MEWCSEYLVAEKPQRQINVVIPNSFAVGGLLSTYGDRENIDDAQSGQTPFGPASRPSRTSRRSKEKIGSGGQRDLSGQVVKQT